MAVSNLVISSASAALGTLDQVGGIHAMIVTLIGTGLIGAAFALAAKGGAYAGAFSRT
jgi:hypothetical protein